MTDVETKVVAERVHQPQLGYALRTWGLAGTQVMRSQAWIITVMLGYIGCGIVMGQVLGEPIKVSLYNAVILQLFLSFGLAAVCLYLIRVLVRHNHERLLAFIYADLRNNHLTPTRILTPIPLLVLTAPFISVVSSIKRLIPVMQPYVWDQAFADLDQALHGGVQPWVIVQPLFEHPYLTSMVSEVYSYPWFFAVALMQFWLIFTSNPNRHRLIMTSLLCWILLGNFAATMFSSAGPAYYAHFVDGPNPYLPLVEYLAQVNAEITLSALTTQDYLLSMYQSGTILPGTGISAMPSMHLSMATIMVLCARHIGRTLTICALAYLVFLELGSVYLGWHYAIDGYASIAGTLAIWFLLGLLERRNSSPSTHAMVS